MPKLDLTAAKQIKGTMGEMLALKGPGFSWAKPATATGIAAMYGTGLGQIPMHLRPEDAVLDGNGNVVSVPNKGGAGAYFNATAGSADAAYIKPVGRVLQWPESGESMNRSIAISAWLDLANDADMDGVRLFVVMGGRRADMPNGRRIATHANGNAIRTSGISVANKTEGVRIQTAANTNGVLMADLPFAITETLFEVQKVGGSLEMLVNGSIKRTATLNLGAPYLIKRLFGDAVSPTADRYGGTVGDVVSRITDGSASMDAGNAAIRQELAAKYGITLG